MKFKATLIYRGEKIAQGEFDDIVCSTEGVPGPKGRTHTSIGNFKVEWQPLADHTLNSI